MPEEVNRYYYPNGMLRTEVRFVNGKFHGARRTWHPNGVLAEEVPFEFGLHHGKCRFWNCDGELLHEFEMVRGTGVAKIWFENGMLKSEAPLKAGVPHGRVLAWNDEGTLISESYWIDGRQVSRKKYTDACVTDPTLPRYENNRSTPAVEQRRAERRSQPAAPSEAERHAHYQIVEGLLRCEHSEALSWLRGSTADVTRRLGELGTTEASIRFVEEAYAAGAKEVLAVEIPPVFEGEQSTGKLLIAMPEDRDARRSLLTWANEEAELMGYDPDFDWGQQHVLVVLD